MFVNAPYGFDRRPLVSGVSKAVRNTREPRYSGQSAAKKKSGISFSEILANEMASEPAKAPHPRTFI